MYVAFYVACSRPRTQLALHAVWTNSSSRQQADSSWLWLAMQQWICYWVPRYGRGNMRCMKGVYGCTNNTAEAKSLQAPSRLGSAARWILDTLQRMRRSS
jgi:hypothetical protein